MPLASTSEPCRETLGCIGFPMKDGARRVTVLVERQALDEIESPPPSGGQDYIDRCEQHRDLLELVASAKYDQGHKDRVNSQVRITTADLSV